VLAWPRHGAALASPLALYAPLSLAPLSTLVFRPRPRTGPPSCFFSCWHRRSHASSSSEFHPLPSPFPPLKLAQGAHHGDVVPHLVTHRRFLHVASTSGALHRHLRPPGYKVPPCLSSLHPTPRSKVEYVESVFSVNAQVREAWEAVGKEVVEGRAARSSRCS
jgi:hypothetical protein